MHQQRLDRLRTAPVVLADGAIETRLRFEFHRPLPDFASFLPLFDPAGRRALAEIYRGYLRIAAESGLPMQVGTPTWRAHPEGLARQGFTAPGDLARVNGEAVALLAGLRRELGLEGSVVIAGVVGPQRDGYDPSDAPDAAAAETYHRPQAEALARAGVDLLYGPTFAGAEELLGLARAFAATGVPYALAPVVGPEGRLRDGTPLADLIARIDGAVTPPPLHFLIGCVHPSHVAEAWATPAWPRSGRVAGLKANASPLPPEALDGSESLQAGDVDGFVAGMEALHRGGFRILGGCCGTGEAHIRALARRFAAEAV